MPVIPTWPGAVKGPNTPPTAADVSTVVAISPNSPVQTPSISDIAASLRLLLDLAANPIWVDASTGRLRITVDNIAPNLALTNVTNVGTLFNITQIGGVSANGSVFDLMSLAYLDGVRPRIT